MFAARFFLVVLVILASSLSASAYDPKDAPYRGGGVIWKESQTFDLHVCNQVSHPVRIALGWWASSNAQSLSVRGWWVITTGKCITLNNAQRGEFYYRAWDGRAAWGGQEDKQFCINPDSFNFQAGYFVCPRPWYVAGFRRITVRNRDYTLDLTD